MDWRQRVVRFAAERGVSALVVPEGVGLEFTDRCDLFWMLPGEFASTAPVPARGPEDLESLLAEFQRIDRLRDRTLHVVRHYLASQKILVDRHRNGEWGVMTEEGMSSTISVGAVVTAQAIQGMGVHQLVKACLEGTILRHAPSPRRIDRYLAIEGPPGEERPIPEESPTIEIKYNLRSVIRMSGICRALETLQDSDAPLSAEALAEASLPQGLLGKTLLRVADRLPQPEASWDLTNHCFGIDFDDGEDDFRIVPKSRELVQLVRSLGPEAAGDRLVEEYQKINAGRTAVLAAVRRVAAARQWNWQQYSSRWHLGSTRREVSFPVGEELSDALRRLSPEQAIREWLSPYPEFAEECVRALGQEGGAGELPEKPLSPDPPSEQPPLLELDETTVAKLDAFADRAIADYFQRKRTIWDYGNRDIFDPAIDVWATMADWVRVAERHIRGEWPDPYAILVLLGAGDPRGTELAHGLLDRVEPHHEVDNGTVELAWRFRNQRPEVARRWFSPEPYDQVPFSEVRARLGDPVARWYVSSGEGVDLLDESTWSVGQNPAIAGLEPSASVREELHSRLLDWARTAWAWSPPDEWPLRTALWLGLTDVADALDENPFLRHGLLYHARREEMFDEPGLLHGSNILYLWSRLKPTDLLGRIIASAVFGNILGRAEQVNREAAARDPRVAQMLPMTIQVLERSNRDLQPPLAIAWKRYRQRREREREL
jgi:hypothetical protein